MAPGLTAARIAELVAELAPLLRGRRVVDVGALPPRDLLVVLEAPERARGEGPAPDRAPVLRLRLSAHPEACRIHLQHGRVRSHQGGTGPFYRRAARELAGAALTALVQPRGDRLAHLSFRGGPEGDRALVLELTGRHANLALLDGSDRVLEVLVPPPAAKVARPPRLRPGEPWVPPPGAPRPAADTPRDEDAPPLPPPPSLAGLAPVSWRVEHELGGEAEEHERGRRLKALRDRLERRRKRARGHVAGLERRRAAAAGAERVRADGELLKSCLHELRRGQREARVPDYYAAVFGDACDAPATPGDLPVRRIELDPKLSPAANAERYFERARKLERALEHLPEETRRGEERLRAVEELLERARAEDADPETLEAEAVSRGVLDPPQEPDARRRSAPSRRLPYRSFTTAGGREARVGRSARDNDALTVRHARGNDLWLHTADAPGSHVVLRVERGAEPSDEDVLDAAHLALHFSPLRGAARAEIHVARCKEVRKPKGAPAGLVHLAGGRTLSLRVEPERLKRLLDRRPEAGDAAREGDR